MKFYEVIRNEGLHTGGELKSLANPVSFIKCWWYIMDPFHREGNWRQREVRWLARLNQSVAFALVYIITGMVDFIGKWRGSCLCSLWSYSHDVPALQAVPYPSCHHGDKVDSALGVRTSWKEYELWSQSCWLSILVLLLITEMPWARHAISWL